MESNKNINGINEAIEFCEDRLSFHQMRSQRHFILSLSALLIGAMVILYGFIGIIRTSESPSSLLTLAAFCVVAFGVLMALHRYHLTEVSKYEHYKLAFARLNIAQSYNERSEDYILSALTTDAFNVKGGSMVGNSAQSPLPGHPASDLSALLVSKLLDNAKAENKSANKAN